MSSSSSRIRLFVGTLAVLSLVPVAACLQPPGASSRVEPAAPVKESAPLPIGSYDVQSIAYDDADGAYRIFLLDAPVFTTSSLRLARLSDDEAAARHGGARLDVDADGPVARLPADFGIQYVHNVTEEVPRGPGGQPETVVVRQESSTWSPFFGALAGMAVGNMLFSPMHYYPPPYMRGSPLVGYGGFGPTRTDAQRSYVQRHGALPQPVRLSQSGYAKAPSTGLRSTGKGAGSSRIDNGPVKTPRPKKSFGGGGFGRRRR
ncbi:MAG: hypothetical protein Q8O67_14765 [Deltaproteobacteria bacterium]|nr:hypothetical protein [Deltaproteobacteria bacterium]